MCMSHLSRGQIPLWTLLAQLFQLQGGNTKKKNQKEVQNLYQESEEMPSFESTNSSVKGTGGDDSKKIFVEVSQHISQVSGAQPR